MGNPIKQRNKEMTAGPVTTEITGFHEIHTTLGADLQNHKHTIELHPDLLHPSEVSLPSEEMPAGNCS